MHPILSDIRLAIRRARKRPGFTLVALLSLTLGIGANTAVFSLVNAILLRRAPIPHPEQIAEIYQKQSDFPYAPFSYPDYVDFKRETATTFSQVSISMFTVAAYDVGDHVETLTGELVNGDYFSLLGLRPAAGRLLGPQDDVSPGAHPVVVLSHDYWQRAFAKDPTVVGRTMRLSGRQYTIVGVAPSSYAGTISGIAPAVFLPIQMINQLQPDVRGDQLKKRGNHSGFLKARLAPGASMAQAKAVAERFTARWRIRYPANWPNGTSLMVIPMTQIAVNPLLDSVVVPAAAALMIVVGLVLLVACANLASFLLAQARDRRKEVAIRLAIGAKRTVLIRQFLVEALVLSAVGGVLGVIVSGVALRAVLSADLPVPLPITIDVGLDWRVLTFAVAASAIAGVLFGLLPALQATRATVVETIKNENADGNGRARRINVRNALVVGQVSVSLTLLITALLFLRSLQARATVNPGFGASPAGMLWIAIPTDRIDSTKRQLLLDDIERRTLRIPGVVTVGTTDNILLNSLSQQGRRITVPGVTPPPGQTAFDVDFAAADSGYLGAIGLPVIRGRGITAADGPHAPRVAVINEAMANQFWPGKDAIGQSFSTDSATYQVVGITRTTKVRSLGEAPRPFIIASFLQEFSSSSFIVARTTGDADRVATQMLATLREIDPGIMVIQAKTMSRHLATMLLPARLGAMAFALFAALALALAVLGVYGVVGYAVARRTREAGIRLAVGAQPSAIVRLLMREGVTLVIVGTVIGMALGFGSAQVLRTLLYGVGASDPVTFLGAPALLLLVGVVAAFLPARRAGRVDPARVLRAE